MTDMIVALCYQSWDDLDHAVTGLADDEAMARVDGGSSIAWTVAHVTQMVDSWLVVNFQALPPHPLLSSADFRTGASGACDDWPAVRRGVDDVRAMARHLLDDPALDLDRSVPYSGSIEFLRPVGLSLRYAVLRIAAHHFTHAGEILAVRSRLGLPVPDDRDWGRRMAGLDTPHAT